MRTALDLWRRTGELLRRAAAANRARLKTHEVRIIRKRHICFTEPIFTEQELDAITAALVVVLTAESKIRTDCDVLVSAFTKIEKLKKASGQ